MSYEMPEEVKPLGNFCETILPHQFDQFRSLKVIPSRPDVLNEKTSFDADPESSLRCFYSTKQKTVQNVHQLKTNKQQQTKDIPEDKEKTSITNSDNVDEIINI